MRIDFLQAQLSEQDVQSCMSRLREYHTHVVRVQNGTQYEAPESSLVLPCDSSILEKVYALRDELIVSGVPKSIIVAGIGGSNLGTQALFEAFCAHKSVPEENAPNLYFAETTDDAQLQALTRHIEGLTKPEEVVLAMISKSGNTIETLFCAEVLIGALVKKFGDTALRRIVVITDESSPLCAEASGKGMHVLTIPPQVGGRFSVFSAVGLFPLSFLSPKVLAVEGLLEGARKSLTANAKDVINPASIFASALYVHAQKGRDVHNMFLFAPVLERLGAWFRQLLAESIGKEHTKKGERRPTGILPIISIGSRDLHATGQLYLGGPDTTLTTFVSFEKKDEVAVLPEGVHFSITKEKFKPGITGARILDAILGGTKAAYTERQLPFIEIKLSGKTEEELGALMQFLMLSVMYVGELFEVNAFDQPNVESYKTETKRLLSQ